MLYRPWKEYHGFYRRKRGRERGRVRGKKKGIEERGQEGREEGGKEGRIKKILDFVCQMVSECLKPKQEYKFWIFTAGKSNRKVRKSKEGWICLLSNDTKFCLR